MVLSVYDKIKNVDNNNNNNNNNIDNNNSNSNSNSYSNNKVIIIITNVIRRDVVVHFTIKAVKINIIEQRLGVTYTSVWFQM